MTTRDGTIATGGGDARGDSAAGGRRAFSVAVFARHVGVDGAPRVLLIRHRRLGVWLPVGGEIEPGETPLEAARREEDFRRHAVAEVEKLDPQPGEEATLDVARRQMQAAERIRGDVALSLIHI